MLLKSPFPLVLFDGECILCNRFFNLLLIVDKEKNFNYGLLQSAQTAELLHNFGFEAGKMESVVVIYNGQLYFRSNAIFCLIENIGGLYKVLLVFKILPLIFRDGIYNIIANNRFSIFGKRNSCLMPDASLKERFIEDNADLMNRITDEIVKKSL